MTRVFYPACPQPASICRCPPAIWNGHDGVVDLLRRYSLRPENLDAEDRKLQEAIRDLLIYEDCIDFHSENFRQESPLVWAAENDDLDVLASALEGPKEVTLLETGNALFVATKNRSRDVLEVLVRGGCMPWGDNTTRFFLWSYVEAATKSFIDILEFLTEFILPNNVEILTKKIPVLNDAVVGKRIDVVRFLLEHDLDVNKKNQDVMIWAESYADAGIVDLLMSHAPRMDVVDSTHGQTPLIWAVQRGHRGNVKALLEHGADPNAMGKCGFSLLSWAQHKGDEVIIEVLKAHGGELRKESKD